MVSFSQVNPLSRITGSSMSSSVIRHSKQSGTSTSNTYFLLVTSFLNYFYTFKQIDRFTWRESSPGVTPELILHSVSIQSMSSRLPVSRFSLSYARIISRSVYSISCSLYHLIFFALRICLLICFSKFYFQLYLESCGPNFQHRYRAFYKLLIP